MKVAVAADHAGCELLPAVVEELRALGCEVLDLGTHDATNGDDYPDHAEDLARAILDGRAERGVLVCGSGVGASVAANKVKGIRAAVCHDTYSAHQGVEHDAMNVLCLGSRVIGEALAVELVRAFIGASYTHEARHQRRIDKVLAMEARFGEK